MKININLPSNRLLLGDINAYDKNNIVVVASRCLGVSDKAYAESFNNPAQDPLKRGGDTPLGVYKGTIEKFTNPSEQQLHSYGPYGLISLTAISGDALIACGPLNKLTNVGGRTGICLHAGVLNPAYTYWNGMRPTYGCVRTLNEIIYTLFSAYEKTNDTEILVNVNAAT